MSDDHQEPSAGDADATRPLSFRPASGDDADATRAADPDATRAVPGPGGPAGRDPVDVTRPLPGGGGPAVPAAWSGRAGVPPPRPAGYAEPGTEWYAEEQADRRWWMPILLGVLALALIALIGLGGWLSLRATERDPGPAPTSPAVPSTAPETSAAPTTTAPSTSPATTPPSTPPATTATPVAMPPLVGLPEATARALLDRLDVPYRVERRTSERPAGTVIESDPAAGQPVAPGDEVTIVVAEAGTPTTGASTATPGRTVTPTP
ncbi:Stk1 family PASTA domain-containing Ser/Thr kinase [Micromonospora narathiwatensis]|uniref:PASTA domain-containing protein n=1 Tax=Micromonospora narathiwatensis TaxID=299146 RepID=A0A1A9ABH5_9ACTN|nr:PASTA domain-containing protein [Micromonospora narathiwatensis]SBT53459.1 PASTA domain-containing protein [Micromonospora narathiwatensis]